MVTKTARAMLNEARNAAKLSNRPGVARKGCVVVVATRYEGPWSYEVGTNAMVRTSGQPRHVMPALEQLLVDYPTSDDWFSVDH